MKSAKLPEGADLRGSTLCVCRFGTSNVRLLNVLERQLSRQQAPKLCLALLTTRLLQDIVEVAAEGAMSGVVGAEGGPLISRAR
jgi:hypothetical protein